MKHYFSHLAEPRGAVDGVERIYTEYLHGASVILA